MPYYSLLKYLYKKIAVSTISFFFANKLREGVLSISMWEPETKKSCQTNERLNPSRAFLQCVELILPWLTPQELANFSLASKSLNQISKSITHRRSSDASRSSENLPIPFHNAADNSPYAYFIYTPSQILPSFASQLLRQSWGSGFSARPNSVSRLCVETVSLVDELGESVSGCDCQRCEDEVRCPCIGLHGLDVASECGPSCGCGLECGNRLTQRGVSLRLKIVRDRRKGWGLFADQFIGKGQFVCEYAGTFFSKIMGSF